MNLLRAGRIFVFEPPPGLKANMLRTFSNIPVARMCKVTYFGKIPILISQSKSTYSVYEIHVYCMYRLPMSVLVSTSCWPGSTPSFRSVCVTHRSDGPRNTSSESRICVLPAIPLTLGSTTLLRSGFISQNDAFELRLHSRSV